MTQLKPTSRIYRFDSKKPGEHFSGKSGDIFHSLHFSVGSMRRRSTLVLCLLKGLWESDIVPKKLQKLVLFFFSFSLKKPWCRRKALNVTTYRARWGKKEMVVATLFYLAWEIYCFLGLIGTVDSWTGIILKGTCTRWKPASWGKPSNKRLCDKLLGAAQ